MKPATRPFEIYWIVMILGLNLSFPCLFLRTRLYRKSLYLSQLYENQKTLAREVDSLKVKHIQKQIQVIQESKPSLFQRR